MNLRQLEHLLGVADTGSFSRAAQRLNLTQSALSRSIQMLEDDLGVRLIDRLGRRNELTPLGEAVAAQARHLVAGAQDLRRSLSWLQRGTGGAIRVGLGSGPGALLMTPFLVHVACEHPEVRVNIMRGSIALQLQQLRQRELDALVVELRSVTPAPDLLIQQVAEMRAGFVCRSGHPLLASGQPVDFDALRRYPLASTPLADEVAQILVRQFGPAAHPEQAVQLRCEDVASLIATVQQSDAIFLGTVAAARAGIQAGELAELPTAPALGASARFAIVTLSGRTESPSMELFRRFVGERLRD